MKGIEDQIRNGEFEPINTNSSAILDDFSEMMSQLTFNSEDESKPRNFVMLTGYSGYWTIKLELAFNTFGKSKLPRKLKKRLFGTKKLRQQFLPQYYGK